MMTETTHKYRILAVDDEIEVLESFQNILQPGHVKGAVQALQSKAFELYSDTAVDEKGSPFELTICQNGEEAVQLVEKSLEEGKPYSVAFLDVRMPPGPDGAWTAKQIHTLDSRINIVIVTAYSDVSPREFAKSFQIPARLFYLQKPLHSDEIRQIANALSENWEIQVELAQDSDFLHDLVESHITALNEAQMEIKNAEKKLHSQTKKVEEVNIALRVILNEKEWERKRYEENLAFNFNQNIAPYLIQLKKTELNAEQKRIVTTIEDNLKYMKDSLTSESISKRLKLSPVELQIANLIKHGKPTKEIAERLNLSPLTIESYRKTIRKKIGLTHSKENLRTWLLEYL